MHEALFPRDWLVTHGYRDDPLGVLKAGKESEVHLLARSDATRTCYIAEKRFTPRAYRSFKADGLYVDGAVRGERREARAIRARTRKGVAMLESRWVGHEWDELVRLFGAGVTVPPPVERIDGGYRMAFIGDDHVAAPRLASVRLDPAVARDAYAQVIAQLRVMVAEQRVHGDLSAFNVLWWRERVVIIDFSQTVDTVTHPAARMLLERDVAQVCAHFARLGVTEARPELAWRTIDAEKALTGQYAT